MNGELKIEITNEAVKVTGVIEDSNMLERVAVVDALMNALGMRGHKRKIACDCLLSVEEAKAMMAEKDIEDLFEKLFGSLKEK